MIGPEGLAVEETPNERPKEYSMSTTHDDARGPSAPAPPMMMATPTLPPRLPKSPGLALVLSIFPGLGQIYNGQPAKAFTFFFSWVGCIYGAAEISGLPFGLLIPFVYFYNLVAAYRSAALINRPALGAQP